MACIQLSFVDGKSKPVQLLATPKPSPLAYKDPFDQAMFEGCVDITEYKIEELKRPGIGFTIT